MARSWDFWDVVLLIGALLILFWALLKALGIIHSAIWVEMLPYFGAGLSLIGAAYKLGKIKNGIDVTERKVDRLLHIEERFRNVETEHSLAMNGKLKIRH
ncbi:MAG: hypothetical protein KKB21_02765 [Nanoarchaeota archaeon]|nr:hypothetical protein [Nanoarchaeota archaeon]MBU4086477.1 hypothetical protein [Nanoarchaeota archaeon]